MVVGRCSNTEYPPDPRQVEKCLFRVPRRALEEGELFQDMFSLPPPEDQIVDGTDEQHPLRLPETYGKAEFRLFLEVLLPS